MKNLAEYTYPNGVNVEISGDMLLALIEVLSRVEKNETTYSFLSTVPKALKKGEIEWTKIPDPEQFFSQEPQETMSVLGAQALDLRFLLTNVHNHYVENGVAVNQTTKENEVKLS